MHLIDRQGVLSMLQGVVVVFIKAEVMNLSKLQLKMYLLMMLLLSQVIHLVTNQNH